MLAAVSMRRFAKLALRHLGRTPTRTFLLYPLVTIAWELFLHQGRIQVQPLFSLLMLVGYLVYRLSTRYRIKHGGGAFGERWENPPEQLVTTGPYGYSRNPVYVGHILFLSGLALFFRSLLAALITVTVAFLLHKRIISDESRLAELFGRSYLEYKDTVKRWIPGLF